MTKSEKEFYSDVADAINDTLEFINEEPCEDCRFKALMSLFMYGMEIGMSGCIIKKDTN